MLETERELALGRLLRPGAERRRFVDGSPSALRIGPNEMVDVVPATKIL